MVTVFSLSVSSSYPLSPDGCADIGSVWANILHNVYAELVTALGWSSKALTNPTTTEGNVVFFHLLFDALLLQPCNPTCELTYLPLHSTVFFTDAGRGT
jgi:hypothetical protein